MEFDTSKDEAHYLFTWQNPQDKTKKTNCPMWTWSQFGREPEFADLKSTYKRYRVKSMYFTVYDVQITRISSSNTTTTEQDITNFML